VWCEESSRYALPGAGNAWKEAVSSSRRKEHRSPNEGWHPAHSSGTLEERFTIRTLVKLGLEGEDRIRIYDLRHSALTRMNLSGMDTFTLMRIAGHASIKTTERYVKVPGDHMRQAVNQLDEYNEKAREATETKTKARSAKQAS
jgi:integrase